MSDSVTQTNKVFSQSEAEASPSFARKFDKNSNLKIYCSHLNLAEQRVNAVQNLSITCLDHFLLARLAGCGESWRRNPPPEKLSKSSLSTRTFNFSNTHTCHLSCTTGVKQSSPKCNPPCCNLFFHIFIDPRCPWGPIFGS